MPSLTYRNDVFIFVLAAYLPAFAIAIRLTFLHGVSRTAGWRFLIMFTLARLLSACFQLATIGYPDNDSLYAGYVVLLNIALCPLELLTLSLLSRVLQSINKTQTTFLKINHIRVVQILVSISLLISIAGGVLTETNWGKTGVFNPSVVSKVGTAVFVVCFAMTIIITGMICKSMHAAEAKEKRLLLVVAISRPFMLVRVIYAAISNFRYTTTFSSLFGDVTILLVMVLIMELIVVVMYEAVGLTLERKPKQSRSSRAEMGSRNASSQHDTTEIQVQSEK